MPGLVIDCYGDTAVMQAHSVGIHVCRKMIAEMLVKVMEGTIRNVFYKSETTLPYKAELGQENGFIIGGSNDNTAMENGLLFHVDWLRGQKTGFFVDQRENRSLLERYAKDKRVLNMFCYTGGFSFYAMRGGAQLVHSVDSSAKAIELTNANVELNFPGDERHKAFCDDAFKFLDNSDDIYDLIILDPPAFTKSREATRKAIKGYREINMKGLKLVADGGYLATCSCSHFMTFDLFSEVIAGAAKAAHVKLRQVEFRTQSPDHPILWSADESYYLKFYIFQCVKER
jgi:23S rRNA (cytosine1962-C5)-methyltransferase